MGITERMWDAITTVIKMNDKIERMADTIKSQQERIENLTGRLIRLETALEIGLARADVTTARATKRRIDHKD
jgi:hypothetical protein